MELFYGRKDSLNSMNWTKTGQPFVDRKVKSDTSEMNSTGRADFYGDEWIDSTMAYVNDTTINRLSPEARKRSETIKRLDDKMYEAVNIQQLGWINCDYIWNDSRPLTDVHFDFDTKDSVRFAKIFILFRDINSVREIYYAEDGPAAAYNMQPIPVNARIRVIAVLVKNDQLFTQSKDIAVAANQTIRFAPVLTEEKDYAGLFRL